MSGLIISGVGICGLISCVFMSARYNPIIRLLFMCIPQNYKRNKHSAAFLLVE